MQYEHLIASDFIGDKGLKELHKKKIAIAGLGGIGTRVAEQFVRMGCEVRIIDNGRVLEEDMSRLTLYTDKDLTKFKANQAKKFLTGANPNAKVKSFNEEIDAESLYLAEADLIFDCLDNMELTEAFEGFTSKKKIGHIFGTVLDNLSIVALGVDGSKVTTLIRGQKSDIETRQKAGKEKGAAPQGIIPPLVSLTADIMVIEGMKFLMGNKPRKKTFVLDAKDMSFK